MTVDMAISHGVRTIKNTQLERVGVWKTPTIVKRCILRAAAHAVFASRLKWRVLRGKANVTWRVCFL